MSEEHVYTEQELSKMADALLEEADHVEIPAEPSRGKKKPAKKKDAAARLCGDLHVIRLFQQRVGHFAQFLLGVNMFF